MNKQLNIKVYMALVRLTHGKKHLTSIIHK